MDLRKPLVGVRLLNLEVQFWPLVRPEWSISRRPGILTVICAWPLAIVWWENLFGD